MVDKPRYKKMTMVETYEEITTPEYIKGNKGICSYCGRERIECMTTCWS